MPAVEIEVRLFVGRQSFQGGLCHLNRSIQETLLEERRSHRKQGSCGPGAVTADPEEHRGAGEEGFGLLEPPLVFAQGALQVIDLAEDPGCRDPLMEDEVAQVAELLVGPAQVPCGAAGVAQGRGGEGGQVGGLGARRRAMDDGAGELRKLTGFAGVRQGAPAALLDQPLGEEGAAEPAAGPVDAGEALLPRQGEQVLAVPLGFAEAGLELRGVPFEHGRERLEKVGRAGHGRLLLLPGADLPPAEGAEALQVMSLNLGQGALGELAARHGPEKLARDVDVAQDHLRRLFLQVSRDGRSVAPGAKPGAGGP